MDTKITLTPVLSTQIDTFKKDLQDAFLKGLIDAFSEAENPIDMGPIPSDKDFDESIHSPESASYYFKLGDTVVGGVVLQINKQAQKNEVDFFYIKADVHSKGLGTKAWFALEENFPQTKSWELHTPYFEKRNIHFYVNKCGFKIVEIYMMEDLNDPTEAGYEFLRFEKIINTKDC